jgi:predicted alpha/beta hydrolase
MENITIQTGDDFNLSATIFQSNIGRHAKGPTILISSAAAVPRQFYRHFAQYLADNGAYAVMTYDYRGINDRLPRTQAMRIRMSDWAVKDFAAAVSELGNRYSGYPMVGLGHSFGGQALGLSGTANQFLRYMTIAAGSGYLGYTAEYHKLRRQMNWFGLPLAAIAGYLPKWAGLGTPMPFGVFNQWRKWCNSPDYFMSDESLPETRRFSDVRIPMMAVGFHDDRWATRRSVEALTRWYSRAEIRLRWFSQEEQHDPVGHFGFFRTDHNETLWPQIADWLVRH